MLTLRVNGWTDMKELIILVASIILGVLLFNLIAGDAPGSTKSTLKNVWQQEMQYKTLRGVE